MQNCKFKCQAFRAFNIKILNTKHMCDLFIVYLWLAYDKYILINVYYLILKKCKKWKEYKNFKP